MYPSQYLPSQEWVSSNKNQIVKYTSYFKIVASMLFVLGDFSAGIFLILQAFLRLAFYFNPIFDQKRESVSQTEFLDDSDPLQDGPRFVQAKGQNNWYKERCLIEFQLTLFMISSFLVVITSTKFGPSAWLRRIKRTIRKTARETKNKFIDWL